MKCACPRIRLSPSGTSSGTRSVVRSCIAVSLPPPSVADPRGRCPRPEDLGSERIVAQDGGMLTSMSLTALTDEHLTAAREAHSGRSAHTLHGGREHALRQTLLALAAGHALSEHESPGEA